jgi:hypothetical protein
LKRSSTGVTCFSWIPGFVLHFFSWGRVLHYTTFTQGTSFQDWTLSFTLLLFFILHFVYYRRSREMECLFGDFLCLTINDREGSQGWRGGLSTGMRAKGIMHHSWVWGGDNTKLIRFFS